MEIIKFQIHTFFVLTEQTKKILDKRNMNEAYKRSALIKAQAAWNWKNLMDISARTHNAKKNKHLLQLFQIGNIIILAHCYF